MRYILYLVRACYVVMALCLLGAGLLSVLRWEPDGIRPMTLRVASPEHEPATGFLAPFGPGYERDLLAEFCRDRPCDLHWQTVADRDQALALLRSGRVDLVVGFPGAGTEERIVVSGPAYYHSRPVQVALPALDVSAFSPDMIKAPPLPEAEAAVPEKDRFSAQRVLDARSWALWAPFIPKSDLGRVSDAADTEGVFTGSESYHWFWRSTNHPLHAALERFWAERTDPEDTLLDRLEERYFGYLPGDVDPYEVTDFLSIVERRLPRYRRMIARAVNKVELDPLLFTAVLIQESRLDESTVSHTGVRGIMQLTRSTADYLNVDRLDPSQAIRGGARYLHMLWKNLEPLELEEWDRWFFALAAFNQGPRRLEGAMELSRKLGGTGRTWKELKEVFPLLSQSKYAAMVGQSTCRGGEAVAFVERVRWYYHILCGLVALDRPEAQHLAPLLRGVPRTAARF